MLVRIYQLSRVTRSVMGARFIVAVEVDSLPDDPDDFAAEHGGDFLQVEENGQTDTR